MPIEKLSRIVLINTHIAAGAADAKEHAAAPAAMRVLVSNILPNFSTDMRQKHISQSAFAKQLSESALYKMYGSTSVS